TLLHGKLLATTSPIHCLSSVEALHELLGNIERRMSDEDELVVLILEVLRRCLQGGGQSLRSAEGQGPGVRHGNRVEVTEAPAEVESELPSRLACRRDRTPRHEQASS